MIGQVRASSVVGVPDGTLSRLRPQPTAPTGAWAALAAMVQFTAAPRMLSGSVLARPPPDYPGSRGGESAREGQDEAINR